MKYADATSVAADRPGDRRRRWLAGAGTAAATALCGDWRTAYLGLGSAADAADDACGRSQAALDRQGHTVSRADRLDAARVGRPAGQSPIAQQLRRADGRSLPEE